jgi:hypothetical protein
MKKLDFDSWQLIIDHVSFSYRKHQIHCPIINFIWNELSYFIWSNLKNI